MELMQQLVHQEREDQRRRVRRSFADCRGPLVNDAEVPLRFHQVYIGTFTGLVRARSRRSSRLGSTAPAGYIIAASADGMRLY